MGKKILLHSCCAPCASGSIERLIEEGYEIILFFGNSNINTREEYETRKAYVEKLAEIYHLKVIEGEYNHEEWLNAIKGFEGAPEKGERCSKCFGFLLSKTAETARKENIANFATSLTISPHKNSQQIELQGSALPGYLHFDFKKKEGYKKSLELSKKYNLYRQHYCACEFSVRKEK